jgi:phosphoglycolate phosphatase-like HAD superfamily hydrolase
MASLPSRPLAPASALDRDESISQTPLVDLILFDIDGTLTHSQSIDSEIYLHSLAEVFGFTKVDADWSAYKHTTDAGILQELFEVRLGRVPTPAEVAAFRSHFVGAIAVAAAQRPFREIDGAGQILRHLAESPSHAVGLATGGWGDSARCKMRSAGLDYDAFPAASADDAISRVSIMQVAIERVTAHVGGLRPDTIVYVGDGIWDARACRQLNLPFIGIAAGPQAERLRAERARAVFSDYSDIIEFCAALARAREPI